MKQQLGSLLSLLPGKDAGKYFNNLHVFLGEIIPMISCLLSIRVRFGMA
jgi:hypothetical protein